MKVEAEMQHRRKHPGFTLVELLVVVAIISLLAALLLPTLRQALIGARMAACQQNMRQIINVAIIYANDYNGMAAHGMGNQSNFADNSFRWGEIELPLALGYIPRGNASLYICGNENLTRPASPGSTLWYQPHSYDGRGHLRVGDTGTTIARPRRNEECAQEGLWLLRHRVPSSYSTGQQFYTSAWGLTQGCNVGYYGGHVTRIHDPDGERYVYSTVDYHLLFWDQSYCVRQLGYAFDRKQHDYDTSPSARYNKWKNGNPGGKPYGDYPGSVADSLLDIALTHKNTSLWPDR